MLVLASFLVFAAAGQTLVILIGGLDLSVASIISATDLVLPTLIGKGWAPDWQSLPFWCSARPSEP